jgi:FMN-dependent NADH-azoreductase
MSATPLTVLQLDASPAGAASVSRELTLAIAAAITAGTPGARRIHRDLAADSIPHLDADVLAALRPTADAAPANARTREAAALNETLVREFLAADVVVVGAPMYNFSVPTQLKAWIDRVAQAGRTFRYTANGPEGLAGGKRVVIVSSRGGKYAGQAFEMALDHQEAYLRAFFGFVGISDVTIVRAEGVAMGPESRAAAIAGALEQRGPLAARIAADAIARAKGAPEAVIAA